MNFFLKSIPPTLKVIAGARIPLRVTQYITERCNLDCLYCARHESGGRELTTGEVKSMMVSFRKAGTLFWAFNGGESLLREDIGELVDFAKSIGMFVNLSTNGTLLWRKCREIRNADLINITLEGPKEIHDGTRSRSYDLMCKGVEALASSGIRFTFTTVINRLNMDFLGSCLDFAGKYGTKVVFQPIRVQNEDRKVKAGSLFPTREEMRRALDFLLLEKARGKPVASSEGYLRQIRTSWPAGRPDMNCWAGRINCSITPEGAVTACCDTLEETRSKGNGRGLENAIEDFYRLKPFECSTCYAAIPLEANIAMTTCVKNPVAVARQVASFLPAPFWRSRADGL